MNHLLQRAKKVCPGLTEVEIDVLMWACTEYPEGRPDVILAALKDAYETSGGDLLQALNQADEQRTARMLRRG